MEAHNSLKKSLLLIPDISGFTKFVNETEIIHGVHIISELLELIIQNNNLGLKVAEIEGDAVLFYKYTDKPSLSQIYKQCRTMFLAFHQHIKLYERDRVCNCGSCSGTPNLTLKFVVHYGDVIERNILGHFQLMGADVTTAHKLMKNNINEDEYILISENSFNVSKTTDIPSWFELKSNSIEYKDVGNVAYHYEKLTPLHDEVPALPERKQFPNEPTQLTLKWNIAHDINSAYALISSVARKHEWIKGVKEIKFDPNKVERIGTKHECITSANTLHIETTTIKDFGDKMVFAEATDAAGIFPSTVQTFTLHKVNQNSCQLTLEVQYKDGLFNKFVFKNLLKKGLSNAIKGFVKVLDNDKKINAQSTT